MKRTSCLFLLVLAALPAFGQGPVGVPRTLDDKPDLQGVWTTRWTTPLERTAAWPTLIISAADGQILEREFHARLDAANPLGVPSRDLTGPLVINGQTRASLITDPADGRVPYTEEGRTRRNRYPPGGAAGTDGPEQRNLTERCLMSGGGYAPFLLQPANNIRQIVQTPSHVVIFTESYYQLRIIPMNGEAGPQIPRGGVSAGRWEGDTLVIETGGYLLGDQFRSGAGGSTFPISTETRITERLSRVGPDAILYQFTVEDPVLYTDMWTGETLMKRSDERMYEFACHEGDYSMVNILQGARFEESLETAALRAAQ